jgi:hypothetical protein
MMPLRRPSHNASRADPAQGAKNLRYLNIARMGRQTLGGHRQRAGEHSGAPANTAFAVDRARPSPLYWAREDSAHTIRRRGWAIRLGKQAEASEALTALAAIPQAPTVEE